MEKQIDVMAKARKHPLWKWYSLRAKIKIRLALFLAKISEKLLK